MKSIRILLWITILLFLTAILLLLILLRYPPRHGTHPPSEFAPRATIANHTEDVRIHHILTGTSLAPDAFVKYGGELQKEAEMPHYVFLIEHPKGDFLIDSGLGKDIAQEMDSVSWLSQLLLDNYRLGKPLAEHPTFLENQDDIKMIIATHGHWDHLSGAQELPETPIWLHSKEIDFLTKEEHPSREGIFPHQVKNLKDRFVPIPFQEEPYENFSQSMDLFGDGSVILVPMEGHTPGSVGVFVNQAPDKRYLFVGDALWGVDEQGKPEARSFLAETFSDEDREEARHTRKKLEELLEHSNEIIMVPTHDPDVPQLLGEGPITKTSL